MPNNKPTKKMTLKEIEMILGHKVQIVDKKIVNIEDIPVGDVFKYCGVEFIVLGSNGDGVEVITRNLHGESVFDSSINDYNGSVAQRKTRRFYEQFSEHQDFKNAIANGDPVMLFDADLTTLDGRKDYENVRDYVGLLDIERYRKYVNILDKHKLDASWMLATAASSKNNGNEKVCFVDSKTNAINFMHISCTCGIRPCLLMRGNVVVEALDY